jgi:PAS domain S-box-containing protein
MPTYQYPEKILSAVQTIDDVIRITSDAHMVLDNVMEKVRHIFQSDRAWLFYPCNPSIASFNVTYESTTHDYPGAKALMADVPMTDDMADYCQRALSDPGKPKWDPAEGEDICNDIAIRFNVRSLMFMALLPQTGDAWMLGIHQCDHQRVWTEHEKQLFRMLGSRITDSLSNMIYLARMKEREERFHSIFDGSRDAIVLTDPSGGIIDANPAALTLFGTAKDALLKMNFQELYVDPKEGIRFQKEIRDKDSVEGFETRLGEIGGREMDCIFNAVSRRDADGTVLEYQGIIRDISEQKRSQEMLKASERRLSQIIEFLPDATMVIDLEGRVVAWNQAMERMTGINAKEILGEGNYEYALPFYGERRPVLIDLVFEWDEEIEKKYEYVKRRGDALVSETYDCLARPGGTLWNMASLLYDAEGEVIGAIESIRDITEQKKSEEREKSQRAYFEGLVDNMPDAIATFDDNGIVTGINAQFTILFGYREEEALGQNISDLVAPSHLVEEAHAYRRRITSGETLDLETVGRRKDGTRIDVSLRSAPVILDDKKIGHLVIYQDISLRKTVETERAQLEVQLREAQKMKAIATLAGGVAHEFNNALMGIMGHIQLLKMDLPEDERRRKSFKTIEASSHRMSRLTDQLLAYAQGGKYKPKPLKMDDFLPQLLAILQHEIKSSVRVETHFERDIPYIEADYTQLQMVISAILSNANESIESEGLIRISATTEHVDEVSAKSCPGLKPGSYLLLTVSDDGRGMDAETRDGIFEPFFTTKFQGRGMGMAAVYGIVKNHGGWIYVKSDVGKGTTVRIYFPVKAGESENIEKPVEDADKRDATILIVDDDEVVLDTTRAMLEHLGYRVLTANRGKEALNAAKTVKNSIDIALLDIKLPDMEGGRLYPLLMELCPNLKVIVFSGYTIEGPAQEILDAGAQAFIQKPFSLSVLSRKIDSVLAGEEPV